MPRYIDADFLKGKVNIRSSHWLNEWDTLGVLSVIDETPTTDVEKVRHGQWIKPSSMSQEVCSNCNKRPMMTFGILPDYCPWCGAEMDLEREEK